VKPSIQFVIREDGVKIAYSIVGKGEPLVFPAPWVTNLSFFLEDPAGIQFWERLSQEMTIVLYDKHGCGHSERDRKLFTMESELLDLETIIDHLALDKFILFGTSMAGPVAVIYTFRHPEKVTCLILYGAFANGKTVAKEEVK
jgi:pimeloyl-ACP methyl ester carboxylesterase